MTGLQRVSFRKGRAKEPRLSPPRVIGRQHERFWNEADLQFLRDNYVEKGAAWCATQLPHRTLSSIYGTAGKLGLRTYVQTKRGRDPELDAKIQEAWPSITGKGDVQRLADALGQPRWYVSKRACALGLTKPRRKEPVWSQAEKDLLRKVPLHSPDLASRMFRAHGFKRTPTAIVMAAKRENLSRRYSETLSGTGVAKLLGIDSKTVTTYCLSGSLLATRRGTKRLPQQGGDAWSIEPRDLRQWIIDNLDTLDIRKVEKFSFVALLTADLA